MGGILCERVTRESGNRAGSHELQTLRTLELTA